MPFTAAPPSSPFVSASSCASQSLPPGLLRAVSRDHGCAASEAVSRSLPSRCAASRLHHAGPCAVLSHRALPRQRAAPRAPEAGPLQPAARRERDEEASREHDDEEASENRLMREGKLVGERRRDGEPEGAGADGEIRVFYSLLPPTRGAHGGVTVESNRIASKGSKLNFQWQ
ncbi:hypothetical protein SETIT_3G152900v2 [Setaria italica]|uniref:Uncharacterized protein n=1 Tax=Setaria italica TaxID=4555 RepID=A0A368QFG1_SETIT|nr:hypothetical protein SETIT_3G152900v2 [Setaria italica]